MNNMTSGLVNLVSNCLAWGFALFMSFLPIWLLIIIAIVS